MIPPFPECIITNGNFMYRCVIRDACALCELGACVCVRALETHRDKDNTRFHCFKNAMAQVSLGIMGTSVQYLI